MSGLAEIVGAITGMVGSIAGIRGREDPFHSKTRYPDLKPYFVVGQTVRMGLFGNDTVPKGSLGTVKRSYNPGEMPVVEIEWHPNQSRPVVERYEYCHEMIFELVQIVK